MPLWWCYNIHMNKQDIINEIGNNDPTNVSFSKHLTIGPYTLSIATGSTSYCSPQRFLADVSEYTEMECAILHPDGSLMGVRDINHIFGSDVAALCEGHGFGDDSSIGEMLQDHSTVMPYITWEQVVMVANAIDQHSK